MKTKDVDFAVHRLMNSIPGLISLGHFPLSSGLHTDTYIQKDLIWVYPRKTNFICQFIAEAVIDTEPKIEVVVAPALGAINLSQGVARHLSNISGEEVRSVYAEKVDSTFRFREVYEKVVRDALVLVVEDVLTTGKSMKKVTDLVRSAGGIVLRGAAVWNRGNVLANDIGIPLLDSLVHMTRDTWVPEECPLCRKGTPLQSKYK